MTQTGPRPRIIVHNADHARAALGAADRRGLAITLQSPPDAAAYMGAAYFQEVIALARDDHPGAEATAVLDCGAEPGLALAALRAGIEAVIFTGNKDSGSILADIPRQLGARLEARDRPALDLLAADDIEAALGEWLSRKLD